MGSSVVQWGFFFFFFFLVLCLTHPDMYMARGCFVEERAALMDIRSSLTSSNGTARRSWGPDGDCCSWERVNCSTSTGRVSHLYFSNLYDSQAFWSFNTTVFSSFPELQFLDLSGIYPSSLNSDGLVGVKLPKLQHLNLSSNWLTETILAPLGEMVSLEVLDVSSNYISGVLPTGVLGNLTNLRELYLSGNNFNGSLPKSLLTLPRLRILDLSSNSLVEGIPISSSSELVLLEVLNLNSNNMSGTIPTEQAFGYLRNLRELHLNSNKFSGNIPTFLFLLPYIERLDLSRNLFEGPITISPSSNLSLSLKGLRFSQNNLTGRVSFFWLRNLTKLEEIDLSGNINLAVDVNLPGWVPMFQLKKLALSGCDLDKGIIAEPHFLCTQHHLQELDLSNNNLSGSMPNWLFTKEATLINLNLGNNSLTGSLDPIWHPQTALKSFIIPTNHIAGKLPANFSSMFPSLSTLDLSGNNFSGQIPISLCHINRMQNLDLSNNEFSGEMPACVLTDFPELWALRASSNHLGGLVLGGMKNLSVGFAIELARNKLEGTLPRHLSGELRFMDLHDNKLSGELDTSFWNLTNLVALNLAGNKITGNVPKKLCNLASILDLSGNNLTGSIPRCSSASLSSLNLSVNSLSGDISDDTFNTSNLIALDMRYNKLTGNLNWLRHFDNIKILSLGWNEFEGQITPNLCKLKCPRIIDFSHNKLSGPLPPCVGNISCDSNTATPSPSPYYGIYLLGLLLTEASISVYNPRVFTFATKGAQYTYGLNFFRLMSGIDLSGNMLSGGIPWELGNLSHIKSLNLSNNFFTGQIPASFANMSETESLDLSHNELSGSIPWQLTRLSSLAVFLVAYNNLSGCIPNSGQFSSFTMDSYQGNSNLHNMSKGNICSPDSGKGNLPSEGRDSMADDPVLYAVSAASFVLAYWTTVAFLFFHPLGRRAIIASRKVLWCGN
uniref:Leucine-rich repeat-containing N-terminal plant-type domain-containing protein n=1 Tax=Oryza brachyantha TaxID=4533 RepID=J3M208_ORYBR